ncbi:hypothetical protein OC834_004760 [Tilletia horrida]|nr:hypothetical protein OC834_004760 [Tilletia horrida]
MISQKRKQPGASTADASKKRARFAAGVPQAGASGGSGSGSTRNGGGKASAGNADGDLDLDEQDRKRTQQGRKGRVVTEGYDSDESAELAVDDEDVESEDDEDEDDGAGKGAGKDDDDDDDMFAAAGEDDDGGGGGDGAAKKKKKKKGDRFLKSSEIEGQEFGGTTKVGDGDQDEALSDEEDEDRDFDLELEDDEDGEGNGDGDGDSLEDDYNARAERTPSPAAGDGADGEDDGDEASKRRREARRAKAKKGMGHKLDSFNMRAEMQSGRFDEDGNYVANSADPHAQHDSWLEGNYSRKKIRAAREAQQKREQEAEAREKLARAGGSKGGVGGTGAVTEVECTVAMLELMERGESVLETLQRLGKEAKIHTGAADGKGKAALSRKAGKYAGKGDAKRRAMALDSEQAEHTSKADTEMDVDPSPSESDAASKANGDDASASASALAGRRAQQQQHPSIVALEQYTALSSELMSNFGHINIYDETYEGILRALRRKGAVPAEWDPAAKRAQQHQPQPQAPTAPSAPPPPQPPAPVQAPPPPSTNDTRLFIYRWAPAYLAATQGANAAPDVETYGPFPATDLRGWAASGYFGAPGQCERILLKESGGGGERWRSWADCGL